LNAAWLASQPQAVRTAFLDGLSANALAALPYLFDFWALPHQLPPAGNWRTWVILGGRGAGKTRAGAEWVRAQVEGRGPRDPGRCRRVALVGETLDQAREIMVRGDSGILACCPPDRRPEWQATRRTLVWPNGAEATIFSAQEPEALRGPQFDAAWLDELAKWKRDSQTWDMLQFGLRLGEHPRQCVTTTPQNKPLLRELLERPTTVQTHAVTEANRAFLAASFLETIRAEKRGTRLERQELDGELLDDVEGALWNSHGLEEATLRQEVPALDRIVVALDPSVTAGENADACGIVVAGAVTRGAPQHWRAYVLEDATVRGTPPGGWAEAAIAALRRYEADRIVAEVNQGGDLVETVLRSVDPLVPITKVRAGRGKGARAEPVAALYEQGRVFHVPGLRELEDQMCRMQLTGYAGTGSPDRLDALVWALWALMIEPARLANAEPRLMVL